MSKKIGIVGWNIGNSFGITLPYANFISTFGEPVILHPKSEINESLDILIIPGGPDVDTLRYNEAPDTYTGKPCQLREFFDRVMLPQYIALEMPIFGICRGMQSIAVHFGAKLDQHIMQEHNDTNDRTELVHKIKFLEGVEYPAGEVAKKDELLGVNSIHHQAVNGNSIVNTPLKVLALHKDLDNVEIITHGSLPIVAVQWHPEEIFDKFTMGVMKYLLEYNNDDINEFNWDLADVAHVAIPSLKEEVNG